MPTKCLAHKREFEGACNWCGAKLCVKCIAKAEGKKIYCEKCVPLLSGLRRTSMPAAPMKPVKVVFAQGTVMFKPVED